MIERRLILPIGLVSVNDFAAQSDVAECIARWCGQTLHAAVTSQEIVPDTQATFAYHLQHTASKQQFRQAAAKKGGCVAFFVWHFLREFSQRGSQCHTASGNEAEAPGEHSPASRSIASPWRFS